MGRASFCRLAMAFTALIATSPISRYAFAFGKQASSGSSRCKHCTTVSGPTPFPVFEHFTAVVRQIPFLKSPSIDVISFPALPIKQFPRSGSCEKISLRSLFHPIHYFNNSSMIPRARLGLTLPPDFRITCPTNQPSRVVLPAR